MMKKILIAALLMLGSTSAFAQCSGQPTPGYVCGNSAASVGLPSFGTQSSLLDRGFGGPSLQGQILNRGASLWSATSTPTLGLNGGTGGSLTLSGSSTGSAAITVAAAAGSTTFRLPVGNGTNGYALTTDGSGNTAWTIVAGTGTVTSVGLSLPGIITVSGSPVTVTGTLTGTLATQTANTVWAGPTSGGVVAPTFRALVGADLPNPTSGSLGGVQSIAAVSHQWISTISTSGVPSLSQPAFTDISGSVAAAQLPNPSSSTLGGVESLAAVTSKWINTISTSGVPSATQPAFTDISGNATLSQLPSIGNNSVLGNNSGGSAIPSALTASQVLDMIASTQGDILYRNASVWTVLAPGTSGYILSTGGPAANPSWINPTNGGTVTTITAGTGITLSSGATCTVTCTASFSTIANHDILANISGGSAAPIANTMTAILDDTMGSTQGNILYRGASNWLVLAPGTNGQVLTQGASTPSWASAGSVTNVTLTAGNGLNSSGTCTITTTGTCTLVVSAVSPPQGRLTLQTGTPVMATSQSAKGTLYYDCYAGGSYVPYYDGSKDQIDAITSCEVSDAMVSAASAGQIVSGQVYDVWWVHGGANRICIAMSASTGGGGGWASDTAGSNTARGTGYSQLDRATRAFTTNKNSITNCFNAATNYGPVSANQGTYLGTIYATANGQTSHTLGASSSGGTAAVFGVWNMYNRVILTTVVNDSAATWSYTSATIRPADNSTGNRISFVSGIAEDGISVAQSNRMATASTGLASSGIGLVSTTVFTAAEVCQYNTASGAGCPVTTAIAPQVGLHFVQALEQGDGSNATTFVGNGVYFNFSAQLRY